MELCKQLGIGRNSLREAYKILEQNGFVTRCKRGTFVNDRETLLKKCPFLSHCVWLMIRRC
ncbi:MAG: GntR family transcriptional regulator [Anaerobutyricum soehngenii]